MTENQPSLAALEVRALELLGRMCYRLSEIEEAILSVASAVDRIIDEGLSISL